MYKKTQDGMTLLEMLISISILAIATTTIISAILYVYKSNRYAMEETIAISNARKGVENMVKDMREAAFSDNGDYPIIEMSTSSISFYSDIDNDNSIEKVSYKINGSFLERGVIESVGFPPVYDQNTEIVSRVSVNIRNNTLAESLFVYKDMSGNPILDNSRVIDVRSVDISLIVNVNPVRAPQDFTLRSGATLRNLINR